MMMELSMSSQASETEHRQIEYSDKTNSYITFTQKLAVIHPFLLLIFLYGQKGASTREGVSSPFFILFGLPVTLFSYFLL